MAVKVTKAEKFWKGLDIFQFKEILWSTMDNRHLPIRCVSDEHLANIIWHCKGNNFQKLVYPKSLIRSLEREASVRNLTSSFLRRAPIPYRKVCGKWNM